ncbi:MAG TPA: nucleotide exchange factor GrpE [Solirubrobacteraceae bacterium]|nr:nucleotide exchange factor GrpE [Solirubrobacteraceae bacterium]
MSDTSEETERERERGRPGADAAPGNGSAPGEGSAPSTSADGDGQVAGQAPVEDGDVAEIEGDLDELIKVGAQRDEYLALAQRTQADFENYRKRVARESALARERGVVKLAKELLPALDNLDRALEEAGTAADPAGTQRAALGRAVCPGGQDDPLLQGVRLVRSEFADALARLGIESYAPAGETFDPSLHEAMASVPQPPDGAASGTVVEVYQPGYRLGEHVIRPARVVVAA